MTRIPACLAALLAVVGTTSAALADEAAFFKDRTINIVVGFGPGGGYDEYARLLARHLGKHVPGNPSVVVQNMPGAASLKAVQYLQTAAPADGTAIVIFNYGQITNSIVMPPKNMKLDFRDFAWLGSMNRDVSVCYVWKARFPNARTPLDLASARQINYGLTGVGSASYFNQMMMIGVFDVPLKQIKGYSGSKEKQIAIERGELDGDCGEWSSVPPDWLRDGKVSVLARFSPHLPEGMPPTIPNAFDIAPSDEKKQMVKLLSTASETGRPFVTRREVPPARLEALRAAFDKSVADPELLVDARRMNREISPLTWRESMAALDELHALPAAVVEKTRAMLPADAQAAQ